MSAPSQGASGSRATGNSNSRSTPPARNPTSSPQPTSTLSTTPALATTSAPSSRPSSAPKVSRQSSSGQLATRAMTSAKSFESGRSSRGSKDSLITRAAKTPDLPPIPNANEVLLKTLQGEFESLRSILTCGICYGLLYEPFTTACGHTYCYLCFCKTFQPNTSPACPECRTQLAYPPAPSYIIREMTHAFLKRQELLPEGETIEQHQKWQKEHADAIQADRNNSKRRGGGLWRGFFTRRFRPPRPIHDAEDNVDRCPFCTWELEDGMCNNCQLPFDEDGNGDWEFSDMDMHSERLSVMGEQDVIIEEYDDDGMDYDEETEWDEYEQMYAGWDQPFSIQRMLSGRPNRPTARRGAASHSAAGSRSGYSASVVGSEMGILEEEDEDEDEEGDDEDSSMSGFIENDLGPNRFTREDTFTSGSQTSSQLTSSSIAEEDEGSEEDEGPIPPGRRRAQQTQSSSSTLTTGSHRPSQQSSARALASQDSRRRRVISETPSSTLSLSAARNEADDEEDDGPIAPSSRRRRRGMSQSEADRRVRPRARRETNEAESQDADESGYRPLGTPYEGDFEDEEEQSDGARTAVGWEQNTSSNERLRNTGSLTPTAGRIQAPDRPPSRTTTSVFPLGSRGIRRRSSVLSTSTAHYEDNDADDDGSDTQLPDAARATLTSRPSRVRLRNNATPQSMLGVSLNSNQNMIDQDESDSTEPSPQPNRRGQINIQRREYNPHISLMLAQHQTEVQASDVERPVYAELEHLRSANRTPVPRPRTSNRNRMNSNQTIANSNPVLTNSAYAPRNLQMTNSATRLRNAAEPAASLANAAATTAATTRSRHDRVPASPRLSVAEGSPGGNSTRFRSPLDILNVQNATSHPISLLYAPRSAPNNQSTALANLSSVQGASSVANVERPNSRVARIASPSINRPPPNINRPPSATNRPPSTGGRRNSIPRPQFPPPQITTSGVGLNAARVWHPNNPFLHAIRPRQSNRGLRTEPSNQTLRSRGSTRAIRVQAAPVTTNEDELDASGLRPQASRLHLRPQQSYRRLQITRDPNIGHRDQVNHGTAPRSPTAAVPTSFDQRVNEIIAQRQQEIAQGGGRASQPVSARQRQTAAEARRLVEERLEAAMSRVLQRPNPAAQTNYTAVPTSLPTTTFTQRRGSRNLPNLPPMGPIVSNPADTVPAYARMGSTTTATAQTGVSDMVRSAGLTAGGDRRRR